MRFKTLVSLVAVLGAGAVIADEPPAPQKAPPAVVYLSGVKAMEKLKATNPDHYARAERIIAAADELCKPGPDQVYFARFNAKEISCQDMMLKTSYPPKREIGFTLDDSRYVALVTVDVQAQFWRVPDDRSAAPGK